MLMPKEIRCQFILKNKMANLLGTEMGHFKDRRSGDPALRPPVPGGTLVTVSLKWAEGAWGAAGREEPLAKKRSK